MADSSSIIQSQALLNAIKEYENNKWKTIGQKVGKPAKVRVIFSSFSELRHSICTLGRITIVLLLTEAFSQACEQYAKEHFSGRNYLIFLGAISHA